MKAAIKNSNEFTNQLMNPYIDFIEERISILNRKSYLYSLILLDRNFLSRIGHSFSLFISLNPFRMHNDYCNHVLWDKAIDFLKGDIEYCYQQVHKSIINDIKLNQIICLEYVYKIIATVTLSLILATVANLANLNSFAFIILPVSLLIIFIFDYKRDFFCQLCEQGQLYCKDFEKDMNKNRFVKENIMPILSGRLS